MPRRRAHSVPIVSNANDQFVHRALVIPSHGADGGQLDTVVAAG